MNKIFKNLSIISFRKPKDLISPIGWVFLQNIVSLIPGICAFIAVFILGAVFYPPYILNDNALIALSVVAFVFMFIQLLVEVFSYSGMYVQFYKRNTENRLNYIDKMKKLPLGFYSSKESGEFISSFSNDFKMIEDLVAAVIPNIFSMGFLLLLGGISFGIYNFPMMLAIYGAFPLSLFVMYFASKLAKKYHNQVLDAKVKSATQLNEYFKGMRVLKSYNQTGSSFKRLKDAYHRLMKVSLRLESIPGSLTSLGATIIKFAVPLAVMTGLYLLMDGKLDVLTFIGLLIMSTKLTTPLVTAIMSILHLKINISAPKRLDSVMTTPSQQGTKIIEKASSFTFSNVTFSYNNGKDVLKDLSFNIPKNKITALVGPSGSGKSTIIRLMARFWDIEKGEILLDGNDVRSITPDSLFKNISMVMQSTYLFKDTVRNNILFGKEGISDEQLQDACKRACCHDFIMKLPKGYDTTIGEGGSTLSGGEKQRISIARALLKDAPILLLDEPTAALDADNERMIQQALEQAAQGCTVIMIAHRLKTVVSADQIIVMENGEIAEKGRHEDLVGNNGLYSRFWKLQQDAENMGFEN